MGTTIEVCPTEKHEAMKADDTAWQSLMFVGIQRPAPWSREPDLELRNCACKSTLARPVKR